MLVLILNVISSKHIDIMEDTNFEIKPDTTLEEFLDLVVKMKQNEIMKEANEKIEVCCFLNRLSSHSF